MKVQECLAAATLVMMFTLCCAHIGGHQISLQDIEPQVYCGRALSTALSLLCFGEPEKRASSNSVYNSVMSQYYKDQDNQLDWPWIPPHRARIMSHPSRGKRYIVNECCDKPCSVTELMAYC
ncbi:bombyxin C-1-like [Epargyreus clarus]|uniref:bombyxin C-1-like n=1 Tax=Epargyreus clarus TaxID=520877 RepID=UPI003C2CED9B